MRALQGARGKGPDGRKRRHRRRGRRGEQARRGPVHWRSLRRSPRQRRQGSRLRGEDGLRKPLCETSLRPPGGGIRALTKPATAKIALIYKKSEAIFASGGGFAEPFGIVKSSRKVLTLRQILPAAKFPRQLHLHPAVTYVYVSSLGCKHSFLVLRAFSTLCQSVDFVNILIPPSTRRRDILLHNPFLSAGQTVCEVIKMGKADLTALLENDAQARDFYPRPARGRARQDQPRSREYRHICRPARAGGAGRAGTVRREKTPRRA